MITVKKIKQKTKDWKLYLWGPLFLLYYWFLWQLDLCGAYYVWKYGSNDYIDGWIFEYILGHEFFRVTSFYNACMIVLLLFPIITFILFNSMYKVVRMERK